jgi:FMN phosphatase YigB (HAD superfamily)
VDEQVWTTVRPEIEAVVFDAGGTLVRLDFEWLAGMLEGLGLEVTPELLRRAEVAGRRRYDAQARPAPVTPQQGPHPVLGSIAPGSAYFGGLIEAAGLAPERHEEALQAIRDRQVPPSLLWARPMEGARHALDALAALGVRTCCVSNSDGRAEHHLVVTGMREGLEIALERLGVRPERSVYVGDIRCVDEAGSRAAGMHFVLVDPFGDYAGEGQLSVRGLAELPALLASRFTLRSRPVGDDRPRS